MNRTRLFPGLYYWLSLPGILAFAGLSGGIALSKYSSAAETLTSFYNLFLLLTTLLSFLAGILSRSALLRFIFFTLTGFSLFTATELKYSTFTKEITSASLQDRETVLTGKIRSPIAKKNSRYQFRFKVAAAHDPIADSLLREKTLLCQSRNPVPPYGAIRIKGYFKLPHPPLGPYGFNEQSFFRTQNIWGKMIVLQTYSTQTSAFPSAAHLSHELRNRVHEVIGKIQNREVRSVFHAAFLGEREHLSGSLKNRFRKAGIFHLLAISGFHAGLLFTAFFAVFKLFKLPSNYCMILALGVLWAYLFFIGFIPSLFRATVMATFVCTSMLIQKKNHILHSLSLAGVFWLFLSPHSLFAPGFQLSFAATAGIILLYPILNSFTPQPQNEASAFILNVIFSSIWVSCAGFLFTTPVLLYHFGSVSLFGLLFNTAAIFLMTLAMWLFFISLACDIFLPFASDLLIKGAELTLSALIKVSGLCENLFLSELTLKSPTALQILTAALFAVGLCAVHKEKRLIYFINAAGIATLIFSLIHLNTSRFQSTEILQLYNRNAALNAILLPRGDVWLIGRGEPKEIEWLCDKGVKPWIHHRYSKKATLVLLNGKSFSIRNQSKADYTQSPTPMAQKTAENNSYRKLSLPIKLIYNKHCWLTISKPKNDSIFLNLKVKEKSVVLPLSPEQLIRNDRNATYLHTKL
ncbi:MAG: ComEC/Rec2 family competence protein [Chitinispirillaceae bacterium]